MFTSIYLRNCATSASYICLTEPISKVVWQLPNAAAT